MERDRGYQEKTRQGKKGERDNEACEKREGE